MILPRRLGIHALSVALLRRDHGLVLGICSSLEQAFGSVASSKISCGVDQHRLELHLTVKHFALDLLYLG